MKWDKMGENTHGNQGNWNVNKHDSKIIDCNTESFNIREYLHTGRMTDKEVDRSEFWLTANSKIRNSGKYNFKGEKIQVNYNWNLNKLNEWLEGYHDRQVMEYF